MKRAIYLFVAALTLIVRSQAGAGEPTPWKVDLKSSSTMPGSTRFVATVNSSGLLHVEKEGLPILKGGALTKTKYDTHLSESEALAIRATAEAAVRQFDLDTPSEPIADAGNYYIRVEVDARSFGASVQNVSTPERAGEQFHVLLDQLNAHLPKPFQIY